MSKGQRIFVSAASAVIALCLLLALCAAGMPKDASVFAAGSSFETNLPDWAAVDGSIWSVTENGFTSDMKSAIEDEPLKYLVKSGRKIDGSKSFRYEVEFVIDGYGAGLSLSTGSRTNFYAVEVNMDGNVYFPTMSKDGWSVFADYASPLGDDEKASFNGRHNMVLEFDAGTKTASVTIDGIVRSEGTAIPGKALGGYLGLYFEGCNSCYFTKAVYTETGESSGSVDLKDYFETNMEFEAVTENGFDYSAKGYGGTYGGDKQQCLSKSNIVIDGTKSFKYEVTFSYSGYGAGMGFNVVDADNYAAVEINTESHVYFPLKIEGNWQTFYPNAPDMTEEGMAKAEHTIEFVFDAYDCYAEVYVDGELYQEIFDLDPEVISGNLGLFFEGATTYYTKAIYTELETKTQAPEQPTEEAAPTEVPATDAPVTATPGSEPAATEPAATENGSKDNKKENNGDLGKILLIAGAGVLTAAGVIAAVVLIKRKKK